MPANKNALMRYRYLDELLSSRVKYYTRQELTDKINEHLATPVSKRCIEKDLVDIQDEWGVEYDEKIYDGKKYIHYADPTFSIFNKELTSEERTMLKSVLDTIGQFDGLPNFEWLEGMRLKLSKGADSVLASSDLEDDHEKKIIEFGSNPYLKNSNMIAGLFQHIASKQAINIYYKPYYAAKAKPELVSPYRLKQFNNRWYLLCCRMPDGRFSNFPLDRMVSYEAAEGVEFMPCPIEIDEHFDDIIGVTYVKDAPVETVVFAGSPKEIQFILTKPLHWTQKRPSAEEQARLHETYPNVPADWIFLTIECKWNFELITTLFSFGERIVVLSPERVVEDIRKKLESMTGYYKLIL
jgi:predicted DNA-binding transcriptional regulator YafY